MLKDYLKRSIPPRSLRCGGMYYATPNMLERYTMHTKHTERNKLPPLKLYKKLGEATDKGTPVLIPRACCPVPLNDQRSRGTPTTYTCNVEPRDDDQVFFINRSVSLIKQGESFVGEAPTGFGKTVVTMPVIAAAGTTVLIMINKEDLEGQWRKSLKDHLGLTDDDIGIIKGDQVKVLGKKVVIGYVQSLYKEGRYAQYVYDYFGLVVVDEVHKIGATEFSNAAWLFSAALWFGLSATPHRKDGQDVIIWAHIGDVKVRVTSVPLTPKVFVSYSDFKVPIVYEYDPSVGHKVPVPIPHKAGRTGHIEKLLAKTETRNDMICEFAAAAYRSGRHIAIFSSTKAHLKVLFDNLIAFGVKRTDIAYYIGGLSEAEREKAKTKRIALCTFQMVDTGTNVPIWDTAILATPRADVVQVIGRVLRKHPNKCDALKPEEGKKPPVVLDIVDSDSAVYLGYFKARSKYYAKINAPIIT